MSEEVKKVKTSKAHRLSETFIKEDIRDVKHYIFTDKLIPMIKGFIVDGTHSALEMLLYGKKSGGPGYGGYTNGIKINYWKPTGITSSPVSMPEPSYRNTRDYDNIWVSTFARAEGIIRSMTEIMKQYQVVSIANLYELASTPDNPIPIEATDWNYGWFSMRGFDTVEYQGGWLIKTPRPVKIK